MAEVTEPRGSVYAAGAAREEPAESLREQLQELRELAQHETVRLADDAREQVKALAHRRKDLVAQRLERVAAALRDAGLQLEREAARPPGSVSGVRPLATGAPSPLPPLDAATRGLCQLADGAAARVDRAARYLRRSEYPDLRRDFESMARRHPLAVVGGSLAAGLLLARFFKSTGERDLPHGVHPGDPGPSGMRREEGREEGGDDGQELD